MNVPVRMVRVGLEAVIRSVMLKQCGTPGL